MKRPDIPADFPRSPILGALPGSQPKLLARKIGDRFVSGWTEEETALRYNVCADLVTQLIPYARRKLDANPAWGRDGLERRLVARIRAKDWELTDAEIYWVVRHACEGL
jgi:hypothetical protein